MTKVTMNIGLRAKAATGNEIAGAARMWAKQHFPEGFQCRYILPVLLTDEPTLVIHGDCSPGFWVGGWNRKVHDLSALLQQDCIAVLVWDKTVGHGFLIGPKAYDWGPFDIAKFHLIAR